MPDSLLRSWPRFFASATYIASRIHALGLIVIDTEMFSRSMPSNRALHVGERVDRDAFAADLALAHRVVAVVAHQRRHVEVGRQAGLPLRDQIFEALVGVLRRCRSRRSGASSSSGRDTWSG